MRTDYQTYIITRTLINDADCAIVNFFSGVHVREHYRRWNTRNHAMYRIPAPQPYTRPTQDEQEARAYLRTGQLEGKRFRESLMLIQESDARKWNQYRSQLEDSRYWRVMCTDIDDSDEFDYIEYDEGTLKPIRWFDRKGGAA